MKKVQRFIINQRVLPVLLLFGLLPRSIVYYPLHSFEVYVYIAIFVVVSFLYLSYRTKIVWKYVNDKKRIIIDLVCISLGVILSCWFNDSVKLSLLFAIFSIPFFVNNYLVVRKYGKADEKTEDGSIS